jgi:activator of 2-hydroxyglutaryl-CoA dehydratase
MIKRVSYDGKIVFTGGVAKNRCMCLLLEQKLGCEVLVPEHPQFVGALGAALISAETSDGPVFKS